MALRSAFLFVSAAVATMVVVMQLRAQRSSVELVRVFSQPQTEPLDEASPVVGPSNLPVEASATAATSTATSPGAPKGIDWIEWAASQARTASTVSNSGDVGTTFSDAKSPPPSSSKVYQLGGTLKGQPADFDMFSDTRGSGGPRPAAMRPPAPPPLPLAFNGTSPRRPHLKVAPLDLKAFTYHVMVRQRCEARLQRKTRQRPSLRRVGCVTRRWYARCGVFRAALPLGGALQVSEKHKLVMATIPKVSCTEFIRLFFRMQGGEGD